MFYRNLLKEDMPTWEKLARSEFNKKDFCSASFLINIWDNIKGWVIMNDEGDWIGCAYIDNRKHPYNKGIHFLEICIFPKYRGQGYSKYLCKLMFDNSIGYRKSTCINAKNTSSISLLTKCGFKVVGPYKYWMVYLCDENHYPDCLNNLNLEYKIF